MNLNDPQSLYYLVLVACFTLTMILGFVMQKSNFCTMGAISDYFLMGNLIRARQWALAIAVAMIGLSFLKYFHVLQIEDSIYVAPKVLWLSTIVGSVMFGFGMVLASGCAGKNLIRLGSGNLRALMVVLVMGLFAQMTLRGIFAVLRVNTVDQIYFTLPTPSDLPSILNHFVQLDDSVVLCLSLLLAGFILLWALKDKEFFTLKYALAGLVVGLCVVVYWWLVGYVSFIEEDPNTLEKAYVASNTNRIELVSFVAPIAYLLDYLTLFSDASKKLTIGIVSIFGVVIGSFIAARVSQVWRLQAFSSLTDLSQHIIGAALMGVGGIMALGCTFGQGLSGISTMSLSAILALFGFIAGAFFALKMLEQNS